MHGTKSLKIENTLERGHGKYWDTFREVLMETSFKISVSWAEIQTYCMS